MSHPIVVETVNGDDALIVITKQEINDLHHEWFSRTLGDPEYNNGETFGDYIVRMCKQ